MADNEQQIDSLKIVVEAEVKKNSASNVNQVAEAITKLQTATQGNWAKLDEITTKLKGLEGLSGLKNLGKGIESLSTGVEKLKNINISSVTDKIKSIYNDLQSLSSGNISFENVKNFGGGINSLRLGLQKIDKLDVNSISGKIKNIALSLEPLKNISVIDKSAVQGIRGLTNSLERLKAISFSGFSAKIQAIVSGLEPLKNISVEFTGLKDFGLGINSLFRGIEKLKTVDITGLDVKIKTLVEAIKPLTNEMIRGGSVALGYGQNMLNMAKATQIANKEIQKTKKSTSGLTGKLAGIASAGMIWRKAWKFGAASLTESAAWIENLNLFEVTFNNASEATLDWAMNIQKAYSVSSNEIIRYTGLFKQMASAIGVVEETAVNLSKSLTLLAYDISSLYNISIEQAMEKLRAGLAGQTKPLRSLGLDITAQSLDKLLKDDMKLIGITSKMLSQSDKFIARGILMLQQASAATGDYAKTINSYANMTKVLTGQIAELKLAFGDILQKIAYPFLVAITAITMGVTNLLRAFSPRKESTGFEAMENDLGAFNDELDETQNKLGLLSFDKFESLNKGSDKLSSTEVTSMLDALFNKTQLEYMDKVEKAMKEIELTAEKLAPILTPIALALAAMVAPKILGGLGGLVGNLVGAKNAVGLLNVKMLLLSAVIGIFVYAYQTSEDFRNSVNALFNSVKLLLQSAMIPLKKLFDSLLPVITTLLDVAIKILIPIIDMVTWVINFLTEAELLEPVMWTLVAILGIYLVASFVSATAAAWSFTAALLANPITWLVLAIVAAVALLVLGIIDLVQNWDIVWNAIVIGANAVWEALKIGAWAIANALIYPFKVLVNILSSIANIAIDIINGIIKGINKVSSIFGKTIGEIPKFQTNWSFETIQKFEMGGMPDKGSLFIANENNKPELVADFGGGTGVANNEMIVESIERAVKNSMLTALRQYGQEQRGTSGNNAVTINFTGDASRFVELLEPKITQTQRNKGII